MLFNMVLMLNLLIAVLSNTYNKFSGFGPELFYNDQYKIYPEYKYHIKYSGLKSSFIPYNVTLIPFMPFYLACANTQKLNQVVLWV